MKPFWLLEKDTFDEEAMGEIRKALNQKGIEHATLDYLDDGIYKYISKPSLLLVPYGSIQFMKSFINDFDNILPHEYGGYAQAMCWCDFDTLNWTNYSSHWSDFLVNDKFAIVPYGVLKKNVSHYFDKYGKDDHHGDMAMFIRPCSNDKIFTGQILYLSEASHTLEYMGYSCPAEIPDDTLTVIAKPQRIIGEWRSLIVNGEVITTSSYSTANNIHKDKNADGHSEVTHFLNKVAQHTWQPEEAYIADVARVDNQYKLLEIGSPNCAGWYAMDVNKVVSSMNGICSAYLKYLERDVFA